MNEQQPGSAIEVLDPVEQRQVGLVIRQATALAGLSPWERRKIDWRFRRCRGQLILQLVELEAQTVYAEAVIAAQGRAGHARERAALALFHEQLDCLVAAGSLRDEALIEAMQLSEDSREVIAGAVDRLTGQYLRGVEKRARTAI